MTTAITDQEFGQLREYLFKSCGIDIPDEKRYLFVTRLGEWIDRYLSAQFRSQVSALWGYIQRNNACAHRDGKLRGREAHGPLPEDCNGLFAAEIQPRKGAVCGPRPAG